MTEFTASKPTRRRFLAGASATGALLVLPACESMGGFSLVDAVRRLLYLSSERAFARMLAPGGYWDDQVATVGLDNLLGVRGNVLSSVLTSTLFRDRLYSAFADIAIEGADRAAPLVTDAVRVVGFDNAIALINGGPTAATDYLERSMGSSLIEAMVPELGTAMRVASDPLVGELIAAATGVNVTQISQSFSGRINNAIWREIGFEESEIRRNPRATNDPLLIGVLGGGSLL